MNEGIKMQISAFVDGELQENEAQLLLRRLSQDLNLRQQAAEYLATGRAMRGQRSVAAIGDLRGRIAASLGDKFVEEPFDDLEPPSSRYVRPLAGFAIAASVALAAIFGLQQMLAPGTAIDASEPVAAGSDVTYTVPDLEYYQRHNEFSSQSGNNNFDARLVAVQILEDGTLETDLEEIDPPGDAVPDSADAESRQRPAP